MISASFTRRLNKAAWNRGLVSVILPDPRHPPMNPEVRESLLKKLAVYKQHRLPDVYLTLAEAADIAGVQKSAVCNWIKSGKLASHTHVSPVSPKRKGRNNLNNPRLRNSRWISFRDLSEFLWNRSPDEPSRNGDR